MSVEEATVPTPTIPKDLQAQYEAACAFATCHSVLGRATYPVALFQDALNCMGFLLKAYEDAVEHAIKHPDAELIPQLKEAKEQLEKKDQANAKG